jgi:hypothetical protein
MLKPLPLPLPPRITYGSQTGFSYGSEDGIGPKTFRGACEHAARILRGRIVEWYDMTDPIEGASSHRSYQEATIVYDYGKMRVRILCNPPIISFTNVDRSRDPRKLAFIDCPMLEAALGEKLDGFILRAADANRQPAPPLTDLLEKEELHIINHNKPRLQRIGELFFNDCD